MRDLREEGLSATRQNHDHGPVSDLKVSSSPDDVLVTYSLGSCIGLALYDPVVRVGGLIHCMLPHSKVDPAQALARPAMFVDTGVSFLLQTVLDLGAAKKNLVAKVAGAGSLLGQEDIFTIGRRNYLVLSEILRRSGIHIQAEDVGGAGARTLFLDMADGVTTVRSGTQEVIL